MMRIMISARNQFVGMVENVKAGAVNGVVTIKSGNEEIKADITMESINQLGLKEGVEAAAVVSCSLPVLSLFRTCLPATSSPASSRT